MLVRCHIFWTSFKYHELFGFYGSRFFPLKRNISSRKSSNGSGNGMEWTIVFVISLLFSYLNTDAYLRTISVISRCLTFICEVGGALNNRATRACLPHKCIQATFKIDVIKLADFKIISLSTTFEYVLPLDITCTWSNVFHARKIPMIHNSHKRHAVAKVVFLWNDVVFRKVW